jgi:hypothetical protein
MLTNEMQSKADDLERSKIVTKKEVEQLNRATRAARQMRHNLHEVAESKVQDVIQKSLIPKWPNWKERSM